MSCTLVTCAAVVWTCGMAAFEASSGVNHGQPVASVNYRYQLLQQLAARDHCILKYSLVAVNSKSRMQLCRGFT